MQRDEALIVDMYQAAKQIAAFKADMVFEKFKADAKTQSAIIHQFLIIGEVAKLLSDEFKKANVTIPWSAMARMRDKLIHHYRGVDLQEIWRAADVEVPKLVEFLRSRIPPLTLDELHS
ncbi:MAG: DUF86 domain-containing protein [Sedimentisphaerales bacterium]|nr:DUF86 domain-containing protein [Sedimentisphaerales bacterium]